MTAIVSGGILNSGHITHSRNGTLVLNYSHCDAFTGMFFTPSRSTRVDSLVFSAKPAYYVSDICLVWGRRPIEKVFFLLY